MRSTKFKERGQNMEQVIREVLFVNECELSRQIKKITFQMNLEGFKLTTLSCVSNQTFDTHHAFLVFTKE